MITIGRSVRFNCLMLGVLLLVGVSTTALVAQGLPARLSDAEFWSMVTGMSEPGGSFRSDNLLSNEMGFQVPIPELQRTIKPGGVYLGVGPEQNFTYIVALQPKMVFIVDIRRDAMLQHLMYKELFELYDNRADFLSHLFSRARPAGLDTGSTAEALFDAYEQSAPSTALFHQTFTAIRDRLITGHGFALTPDDTTRMMAIFDAFLRGGPAINYSYCGGSCAGGGGVIGGRGGMATYHTLMATTDGTGRDRSYLATEANYRAMRDLEGKNLLVPLTGNFGGPKAIRAVGQYVKAHQATVTAFYTSNVEQYLFQDNIWREYYANVATLPLDATSTFIRSRGGGGAGCSGANGFIGGGGGRGGRGGGGLNSSVIGSIVDLLKAVSDGRITCYGDIFTYTH